MKTNKNNTDKCNIIFDLGGVLIDWNPDYLYNKMFGENVEDQEFFLKNVCHLEWNANQDAGTPFAEAIQERIEKFPEYEKYIRAYFERWEEMLGDAVQGTVDIFSKLRQQDYRILALSNWSAETYPIASSRFEFLNWFDEVVISGEVKTAKPDARIFHILLERAELLAEECLFIDDAEKNILAAKQLGFQTILFENPEQLRDELIRKKILPDAK